MMEHICDDCPIYREGNLFTCGLDKTPRSRNYVCTYPLGLIFQITIEEFSEFARESDKRMQRFIKRLRFLEERLNETQRGS